MKILCPNQVIQNVLHAYRNKRLSVRNLQLYYKHRVVAISFLILLKYWKHVSVPCQKQPWRCNPEIIMAIGDVKNILWMAHFWTDIIDMPNLHYRVDPA